MNGAAATSDACELSVVIITYNSADWILRCMAAIDPGLAGRTAEIVIIDNASQDGSADVVAKHYPSIDLVRNARNVGFAAAVNQGVSRTHAPYVLLLNPDVVVQPGSLDALITFAEAHASNGMYGGRALHADGTVELSSCWALPSLWSLVCFAAGVTGRLSGSRWFDPEAMGWWARDSVREVGMITGCLLLVPRAVWDELDGLDERYFVYGEDADFAARAHRVGYRPIITPDAVFFHEIGASSSDGSAKLTLLMAGKITFVQTHWRGWRRLLGVALLRWGSGFRALVARVSGNGTRWVGAWANRRTWWHGFPLPSEVVGTAPK